MQGVWKYVECVNIKILLLIKIMSSELFLPSVDVVFGRICAYTSI